MSSVVVDKSPANETAMINKIMKRIQKSTGNRIRLEKTFDPHISYIAEMRPIRILGIQIPFVTQKIPLVSISKHPFRFGCVEVSVSSPAGYIVADELQREAAESGWTDVLVKEL